MRSFLVSLALVAFFVGPAFAQDDGTPATSAAGPSPEAAKAIWCGAAFAVAGDRLKAAGDAIGGEELAVKADAAFETAAAELIVAGVTVDQFEALAQQAALDATAPFRLVQFTEAECEAVVPNP